MDSHLFSFNSNRIFGKIALLSFQVKWMYQFLLMSYFAKAFRINRYGYNINTQGTWFPFEKVQSASHFNEWQQKQLQ